jgi:Phage tail lysozyme
MLIKEIVTESEDPLGQLIQKIDPPTDPIEQLALKFSSAFPDQPATAKTAPVKQAQTKPTVLPAQNIKPVVLAPKPVAKAPVSIPTAPGAIPWTQIGAYLKSKGLSNSHVSGILANMQTESQFVPGTLVTDSNGLPSGGLFQHNGPRFQQMVQSLGRSWATNWRGQIDFALNEPPGMQYKAMRFPNAVQASRWWTLHFERPKHGAAQANKRAQTVRQYASL